MAADDDRGPEAGDGGGGVGERGVGEGGARRQLQVELEAGARARRQRAQRRDQVGERQHRRLRVSDAGGVAVQEAGGGGERQGRHPAAAGGGRPERGVVGDEEAVIGGGDDVDLEAGAAPPAERQVGRPERRLVRAGPELVPLQPDRPVRAVDGDRDGRHAGGCTRAPGSRRSLALSKTSESSGAKPTRTGSPAAWAEAPCPSTRTRPTSVLTT